MGQKTCVSDILHSDATIFNHMKVDWQQSGTQSHVTRHTSVHKMLPHQQGATTNPKYEARLSTRNTFRDNY